MRMINWSRIARSWQLILLAITSVVLSLASGWTTWIGMRNFTDEAVLSFMITFGIQGVMLVLSWLVGVRLSEFMAAQPGSGAASATGKDGPISVVANVLRVFIVAASCVLVIALGYRFGAESPIPEIEALLRIMPLQGLAGAIFVAVLGLLVMRFGTGLVDHVVSLFQFAGRNVIPLVMLAGCLASSVFFSFDALFATIVPKDERERIAELRSKTEVAAIINRIAETADRNRQTATRQLLASDQWKAYVAQLEDIRRGVVQVPEIVRQRVAKLQQDSLAASREGAALAGRLGQQRAIKVEDRDRLEARVAGVSKQIALIDAEIGKLRQRRFALEREVVDKEAERDAEERGLGASAQAGRGPIYRRLSKELAKLNAALANVNLKAGKLEAERRENQAIAIALKNKIAALDNDIRLLDDKIALAKTEGGAIGEMPPVAAVERTAKAAGDKLDAARLAFARRPTPQALTALGAACTEADRFRTAYGATSTDGSTGKAADCSSAAVQGLASRAFALDRGQAQLSSRCVGKNDAVEQRSFAERLAFARDCLNWSELSASGAGPIANAINRLERERDDKAHRFVVTSNAFFDGNKLALLALAIAAAIDALVLASGLLGATAVRSPLAGRGLSTAHTAAQREAVVVAALLPNVALNARLALEAFVPHAPAGHAQGDGAWTHQADPAAVQDVARNLNMRKLLNAAAAIGAARPIEDEGGVYAIRSALIEFLAQLSEGARDASDPFRDLPAALIRALGDRPVEGAKTVLGYVMPSVREAGYTSGIDIAAIEQADEETLRRCLNVATVYGLVGQPENGKPASIVLLKPQFYLALLDLASMPVSAASAIGAEAGSDVRDEKRGTAADDEHEWVAAAAAALRHDQRNGGSRSPERDGEQAAQVSHPAVAPGGDADVNVRVSPEAGVVGGTAEIMPAQSRRRRPKVIITDDTFSFD